MVEEGEKSEERQHDRHLSYTFTGISTRHPSVTKILPKTEISKHNYPNPNYPEPNYPKIHNPTS